jgi:hypothetical protein
MDHKRFNLKPASLPSRQVPLTLIGFSDIGFLKDPSDLPSREDLLYQAGNPQYPVELVAEDTCSD